MAPRQGLRYVRRVKPTQSEGMGVGLTAVRRLLEKAGGTVTLESDLVRGANFTIRLPVRVLTASQEAVASDKLH